LGTAEQAGEAPLLTPGVHPLCYAGKHSTKVNRPSALQGLFLLFTRGADNSRTTYSAPGCPRELQEFHLHKPRSSLTGIFCTVLMGGGGGGVGPVGP
jgi:hypothetical protein